MISLTTSCLWTDCPRATRAWTSQTTPSLWLGISGDVWRRRMECVWRHPSSGRRRPLQPTRSNSTSAGRNLTSCLSPPTNRCMTSPTTSRTDFTSLAASRGRWATCSSTRSRPQRKQKSKRAKWAVGQHRIVSKVGVKRTSLREMMVKRSLVSTCLLPLNRRSMRAMQRSSYRSKCKQCSKKMTRSLFTTCKRRMTTTSLFTTSKKTTTTTTTSSFTTFRTTRTLLSTPCRPGQTKRAHSGPPHHAKCRGCSGE
mmetsp:Transcript_61555/g.145531  ORF Transcript_61555/g.145531 Transcript_61555/m.145531 type:complete len:254 (+) Transcript_61555:913-1674(+)